MLILSYGFTKLSFLKAVRNIKVGPVLQFIDEIFNMFGVTRRIICDRGNNFTSKRFGEYYKTMGIKVNYNATATPRANGQEERYNRTILNAISASTDDERNWDEAVQHVQWGLNTSLNKTTGKTPYELLLSYRPKQANDSFLSAEVSDKLRDEYLLDTRRQTSERIRTKQV
jgi:IS30 family transposase